MIAEISMGPYSKCRLWFGELPDLRSLGSDESIFQLPVGPAAAPIACKLAVEVFVATGKDDAGILGGTYTPNKSHVLTVAIPSSATPGDEIEWSYASRKHDEVRKGLPPEYVDAAWKGVADASQMATLGPGTLRLDCAAHSAVSSSYSQFRRLARLVCLVAALREPPTEEALSALAATYRQVEPTR